MKNTLWLFISFFILVSCEEENPGIIFTNPPTLLKDTSYVTTDYGPSVYKKILLEDLTGVRCVNCPDAAAKAKELKGVYGDTLVVVGLYLRSPNLNQFTAPWSGFPDLRSNEAEVIANAVGVPSSLPNGYIDRYKFGGTQAAFVINQWDNYVKQRRGESPVKVWLNFEIGANNNMILKTRLTYTKDISGKQHKLALYITENDIFSKQSTMSDTVSNTIWNGKEFTKSKGYLDDYSHQHVLRTAVTLPLGQLLNQPLELGRVFEKDFPFEWPSVWNRNKAYLVAVVIDSYDESVVQVEEIKLY